MVARMTEIPPPAMNVYRRRQGSVSPAAHFLTGMERRRYSERFIPHKKSVKERKATIPRWSPEMARRWAIPVVMKDSLISSGMVSCSPRTSAWKREEDGGVASFCKKLRMWSLQDSIFRRIEFLNPSPTLTHPRSLDKNPMV